MSIVHPESNVHLHPSGLSIASQPLLEFPWLKHCSTTRDFSTPDSPKVFELEKVREHLTAYNSLLVYCEQKHTNHVAIVTRDVLTQSRPGGHYRFQHTDGIVCAEANVTLAIMTADCAPVFLVDPVNRVIGLVHAGWKGTISRIAAVAVSRMKELGSIPSDIVAWVGPMANACCYEVSAELIEQFKNEFSEFPAELIHRERQLDLVAVNCLQLEQAGLQSGNVHRSNVCTIHQSEMFYSYRADNGTHGRIISAMSITQDSSGA